KLLTSVPIVGKSLEPRKACSVIKFVTKRTLNVDNVLKYSFPWKICGTLSHNALLFRGEKTSLFVFFTTLPSFESHIRIHIQENPFVCSLCPKSYAAKSSFRYHQRTHESFTKSFKCPLCPKTFRFSSGIKPHLQTHTGERPLPCPICTNRSAPPLTSTIQVPAKFKTSYSSCARKIAQYSLTYVGKSLLILFHCKIHLMTHLNEHPYKCSICGKRFSQQSGLKYHRDIHNNIKSFKCSHCPKFFRQSSSRHKYYLRGILINRILCKMLLPF
ncbi:putative zinc finger protein, partial [Orchesella cincta]